MSSWSHLHRYINRIPRILLSADSFYAPRLSSSMLQMRVGLERTGPALLSPLGYNWFFPVFISCPYFFFFFLLPLLEALQVDELGVAAATAHELVVGALLDDAALVEDVDDVGTLDGGEAVGDGDGGAALGGLVKGRLDHVLGLGVERARRLVEE